MLRTPTCSCSNHASSPSTSTDGSTDQRLRVPAVRARIAAFTERFWGEPSRRFCLLWRLLSGFMRLALLRVDLRVGLAGARESSSANAAFRDAWEARFRAAVDGPPLLRRLALAPFREVSTTSPGGGVRARVVRDLGRARSCAALNCSALVAIHRFVLRKTGVRHAHFGRGGRRLESRGGQGRSGVHVRRMRIGIPLAIPIPRCYLPRRISLFAPGPIDASKNAANITAARG
jgi:hypothetical protein